ncbi:MAG: methylated-DNA--[protein]-cysteine S-methyltransferase [Phycisphaerae bacterium]
MERAVNSSDASYDGIFVVAVQTTGIFCRPSCPARKPKPSNTEFFSGPREAILAGYRPCRRCRPMDANGRPPDWVRQLFTLLESAPGRRLTDAELRDSSIDPARARRFFRNHYGMTFQAYARSRRLGLALAEIRRGSDLMHVAMKHGYESTSGFRDAFSRTFGTSPGRGRSDRCIYTTTMESPIGPLHLGATDDAVCLVEFGDRRGLETQIAVMQKRFGCAVVPGRNARIEQLTHQFAAYFEGTRTRFDVPLEFPGTQFQRTVWKRLLKIPIGETLSYEALAQSVGRPGAQRAVGRANGDNRIAIVIPCHRVVNKNGKLGGYGGGLWRKQFLLDHERRVHRGEPVTLFEAAAR